MKALIVIGIPEDHLAVTLNDLYERLKGYKCDLIPMPQKKKHSEQEDTAEDDYEDEYDYWEIEGYNACLDEILGETE